MLAFFFFFFYLDSETQALIQTVWVKVGICTADSIINLALCCLGYVPGLLHAWYIIIKNPEPDDDDPNYQAIPGGSSGSRQDPEQGRVTYYYVSRAPYQNLPTGRTYGTVGNQPGAPASKNAPAPAPYSDEPHGGDGGQGSSEGHAHAPPTYAEAVKGDHKVQTQD